METKTHDKFSKCWLDCSYTKPSYVTNQSINPIKQRIKWTVIRSIIMIVDIFKNKQSHSDVRCEQTHYLFQDVVISENLEYFTGLTPEILGNRQIVIEEIHGLTHPDLKDVFGWPNRNKAFEELSLDADDAIFDADCPGKILEIWQMYHTPNYGGEIFQLNHTYPKQIQLFESSYEPTILILHGNTGIGKTALALHLLDYFGYAEHSSRTVKANLTEYKKNKEVPIFLIDDLKVYEDSHLDELVRLMRNGISKIMITTEAYNMNDLMYSDRLNMDYSDFSPYEGNIFFITPIYKKQMRLPAL